MKPVKDIYNLEVETDNTIDDIDEEPVIQQQQEITGKEAKHPNPDKQYVMYFYGEIPEYR